MSTRVILTFLFSAVVMLACGTTVTVVQDDDDASGGSGASGTGGAGGAPLPQVGPGPGPGPGPGGPGPGGPGPGPGSGSGFPGTGICSSGLTTGSGALDACLTVECCPSFDACVADTDCQACLTNAMAPGCDSNQLLATFESCFETHCPDDICDTGIGYPDYDINFPIACNECASMNCCAPIDTCVGSGSGQDVSNCLDCLEDPDSMACAAHGAIVQDAARQFNACVEMSCGFTTCSF